MSSHEIYAKYSPAPELLGQLLWVSGDTVVSYCQSAIQLAGMSLKDKHACHAWL